MTTLQTKKLLHLIIFAAAFYGGLAALWKTVGWIPALAVFLMFCAHNSEYHRTKL